MIISGFSAYSYIKVSNAYPTAGGIEALNGLLLIAWTGSFIFLAMGHLWPWQNCKEPQRKNSSPQIS